MSENNKWKSKLLSASFPLEFDTAKVLANKGFYIQSDYTYSRMDCGVNKDFSVDILASGTAPFDDPNKCVVDLELLVECKYRDRNTTWLFLPDVNKESLMTDGEFLRIFDNFSEFNFTSLEKLEIFLSENCQYAYKATEVKMGSEPKVYDSEIKHGLSQLQYALPRLISEKIFMTGLYPAEDNHPFVICPILVTTAKLLVVNELMSMSKVEQIDNIDELGEKVPYVIIEYDYGPDFERHCSEVFRGLDDLESDEGVQELEELRRNSKLKEYDFEYPSRIGISLADCERFRMHRYFLQFIVCNYDALPALLDEIKLIVEDMSLKIERY